MNRYLLDTHVVIGLLTGNSEHLPGSIREDIETFRYDYYVSAASLIEMTDKQQKKGEVIVPGDVEEWIGLLRERAVEVLDITPDIVRRFSREGIPESQVLKHKDPFDRLIIATALTHRLTLISADRKFPWWQRYRKLSLCYLGE